MAFDDLRDFIKVVEGMGELKVIEGADCESEIGTITELCIADIPNPPALLFDKIKGYPAGYRVASSLFPTEKRLALAVGLPTQLSGIKLVDAWRKRMREVKPLPPVEVKDGPVMENIYEGDDVDLLKFPSPKWHELDGGRYIGTGHCVIQRDPDTGIVNLGTYRVMVVDEKRLTIYIVGGKHGDMIRKKYWDAGQNCPIAVSFGQDPSLFAMASNPIVPWGESEYDYAGWLRNEPVKVIKGPLTGLPIPATAEIVIEGEMPPPTVESAPEGPFGEWPGYYASGARQEPVIRVKRLYHRNHPILQGNPPLKPPARYTLGGELVNAAAIWDELEKNVPGVKGVWTMREGGYIPRIMVISIKQSHPGHAQRAGLFATSCYPGAYAGAFTIVVDDDIDPSNISDVLWAISTRCDPATSIQILNNCWTSALDTVVSPEKKRRGDLTKGRAIIYACKPYDWKDEFPPVISSSPELKKKIMDKWYKFLVE